MDLSFEGCSGNHATNGANGTPDLSTGTRICSYTTLIPNASNKHNIRNTSSAIYHLFEAEIQGALRATGYETANTAIKGMLNRVKAT